MVERFGEEFFERAMHPKEMMRMMEMRPELAIEWLRLMREFDIHIWGKNLLKFFLHEVHSEHAASIFLKSQDAALAMIRVLHLCSDKRFSQYLESVYQKVHFSPALRWRFDVTKVPIDFIVDLTLYARANDNSDLLRDIDHYISLVKSEKH